MNWSFAFYCALFILLGNNRLKSYHTTAGVVPPARKIWQHGTKSVRFTMCATYLVLVTVETVFVWTVWFFVYNTVNNWTGGALIW